MPTPPLPPSWLNKTILTRQVVLETTVGRVLTFHGYLVLALKHPGAPRGTSRHIVEEMLDTLESIFEEVGLEPPPPGWRGEREAPPQGRCLPPSLHPDCQCYPDRVRAFFCPTGHLLECHYPLDCRQAQCSHYG